jgi:phosphopantetheine binding protein
LDPQQRLALLEQIQRNVFEAHRHFQETMAQSQAAFLQASEALLRQISAPPGTVPFEPPAAAPPPRSYSPAPVISLPLPPVPLRAAPQSAANGHSSPSPRVTVAAPERAGVTAPVRDFQAIILATVAETTGYPADMIELDMELEAGLGIDSIKKVEIFSALQGKVPEFAGADAAQVSKLGTLREILRFTEELTGGAGEGQKKN